VTFLYQLGLGLVALAMLLLPLIYLALIGLVGYGVYYHATENAGIITAAETGLRWRLIAYATPILAGVTALLFMVKPLFAPRVTPPPPHSLRSDDEPFLHQYIERLCHLLGAPCPQRIDLDMQVNASASFRRGMLSFFTGDLVLTIGMPLAGGLTVRDFTGVLAHEFGHFTQSAAMRLGYIIQSVNMWFARVVYERDEWDETLAQAQQSNFATVQVVVGVCRLCVWLSRRILWVLMMIGHGVSAFMSRQMEFNADEHHALVAGSDSIRDAHFRIHQLSAAMEGTVAHLGEMWGERRLADDAVTLTQRHYGKLAENGDAKAELEVALIRTATRMFDTHPAPRDRIARVSTLELEGVVDSMQPASTLFEDFSSLSKVLSLKFYQEQLGEELSPDNLIPTERAIEAQAALAAAAAASNEFFSHSALAGVGVFPAALEPTKDPVGAQDVLEYRDAMRTKLEQSKPVLERLSAVWSERGKLGIGLCMAAAGIQFDPDEQGLPSRDRVELRQWWASKRDQEDELQRQLAATCSAAADRATAAFRFARTEESQLGGQARTILARAGAIGSTYAAFEMVWPKLMALAESVNQLGFLFQFVGTHQHEEDFQKKAAELVNDIRSSVHHIRQSIWEIKYPYDHADGVIPLERYLVPEPPAGDAMIINTGSQLLDRAHSLYSSESCAAELMRGREH
jgi:Zn-dependent protease with chaperone function